MTAIRIRGQSAATAAIRSFATGGSPHAVLLVGPPSVGKTTLALDLAVTLLCVSPDPASRPCGACRGCRLVASGNHPDLHRLAPEGPGGQIRIGDAVDPAPGTVRRFIRDLALLPVEGGARVAVLEHADRLNDAAQDALLKTLEEPPAGVTIILAADDEERLLPTVRSRCARIRLGSVEIREMEDLLGELGLVDAPTAARLARVAGGRPGVAVAYARAPEALLARASLARTLLDLLDRRPYERLGAIRGLQTEALAAADRLTEVAGSAGDGPGTPGEGQPATGRRQPATGRGRRPARPTDRIDAAPAAAAGQGEEVTGDSADPAGRADAPDAPGSAGDEGPPTPAKLAAAQRRRAAAWLVATWRDVARDLVALAADGPGAVRDPALLDDLAAALDGVPADELVDFLGRVVRAEELLEANAAPELLLDTLVLAWPHRHAA